jgi:hypothetical protein
MRSQELIKSWLVESALLENTFSGGMWMKRTIITGTMLLALAATSAFAAQNKNAGSKKPAAKPAAAASNSNAKGGASTGGSKKGHRRHHKKHHRKSKKS